jgi:hypothetical protein
MPSDYDPTGGNRFSEKIMRNPKNLDQDPDRIVS